VDCRVCPGRTTPIGTLLLAGHDPQTGTLRYCGSVSAGLGPRISHALHEAFAGHLATTAPWTTHPSPPNAESSVVWLRPGCTAALEYREYTPGGRFRHLAFKGLLDADAHTSSWVPLPAAAAPTTADQPPPISA
jgi:bifunctional non-homologous end joining protein LigD